MKLIESIQLMNKLQAQLDQPYNNLLSTHDLSIQYQNQVQIDAINQLLQALQPIFNLENRINEINATFKPLYESSLAYEYITSSIHNIFAVQHQLIQDLMNIDINLASNSITYESSLKFSEISLEAINEFDYDNLSENVSENISKAKETVIEYSSKNQALSWGHIISIVGLLISAIMLIQSMKPNEQLINIEKQLQQLIDIQTKELDLLKQISE